LAYRGGSAKNLYTNRTGEKIAAEKKSRRASVGSRDWAPHGGICVLLANALVRTVTRFSAVEKDSGVKLCMLVRLLSGMSFSHFGEPWLAGSHGCGITFWDVCGH